MTRVNGIKAISYQGTGSLFSTKRAPFDSSELYIQSSLNQIYKKTVANCFINEKLGSIRDFVNGKKNNSSRYA